MISYSLPSRGNRKINPKSVFLLYVQLKAHFQGKFDVIQYNWTIRISDKSFEKRKDKYFFQKLSQKYTLRELCMLFICNFSANENYWVGDLISDDAIEYYNEQSSRLEALSTVYVDDIKSLYYFAKKINKPLREVVYMTDGKSPILRMIQSHIISIETFLILDSFLGIIDNHDKNSNVMWERYSVKLKAYKKLVSIDKINAKTCFQNTIKELKCLANQS